MPITHFRDRRDAGRKLAMALRSYRLSDAAVVALPRGGVVVGAEVAHLLRLPLSAVLVRKIAHPFRQEYAIGAVAEDDEPLYNKREMEACDPAYLQRATDEARSVIAMRRSYYYQGHSGPPNVAGKTVIVVDDGIATSLTMQAAVHFIRRRHPKHIVVAVPVAPQEVVAELNAIADEVIRLGELDTYIGAVGAHYEHFEQVDDAEVRALLQKSHDERAGTS